MLKYLDLLIGLSTVMLLGSTIVSFIMQWISDLLNRRAARLLAGLASLLHQCDSRLTPEIASKIARAVLSHPLVRGFAGRLGSVVQREELIRLLLELASSESPHLDPESKQVLRDVFAQSGKDEPEKALQNIRSLTIKLETSNPELATHTRNQIAIATEVAGTFVNHLLCSFDSCVDRISHVFQTEMRLWGILVALVVAFSLQLDTFRLVNQLSTDTQLRALMIQQGAATVERETSRDSLSAANHGALLVAQSEDLTALLTSGLVTPPSAEWTKEWSWERLPGILITAILLSLGAPFWFGILKNLLRLRPLLAAKDDQDRQERRATQEAPSPGPARPSAVSAILGERGDLGDSGAVG